MKLKANDLPNRLTALRHGTLKVPEAILLFGQDQGLINAALTALRQATFAEEQADFNLETFYAGDLNVERLLNSCQSYPFLAPRRLVILKDGDQLNAAHTQLLMHYLRRPSPTTLLLVLAGNLEIQHALRKGFDQHESAWSIPFYTLEGRELRQWLVQQLQQEGFQVEDDALQSLCDHLAGDTRNSRQELDKLILFMGEQRRIRLEDVLAMVGETTTHSSFGLAAAITAGQSGTALSILDKLLESGEEPILLLGVISQRLRRLVLCADGLQQGKEPKALAAQLQIFWKEQAQFFEQSRAIAPRKLADSLLDCLEADRQLKGGSDAPLPTAQIMGRLVMRLSNRFSSRFGSRR
ncbi:MAG: DNA polymerase III subunit delta [Magnetococcales bacterium]|nr:DNA polymerase III subunit delta [Magnetococcales bacterium]